MILQTVHDRSEESHGMAPVFQIQQYRNSDNLHLRLTGVFDEEAALTLMEAITENRALVKKILVHTAALDQVLDSAAELFRRSLHSLDLRRTELIFTGKKGEQLALKAPGVRLMR